ncbi:hypothetical protein QBC35DRAFT_527096 [Podospora australis]|uniref:EF-hand domain-containing protein n=1 Tax=Podospora australis TaxID=1536484 RepID=A0AAN6X559_9PEZI|nr:hypothetical protein QBC35DRAFT_527096 [Podospora australis]
MFKFPSVRSSQQTMTENYADNLETAQHKQGREGKEKMADILASSGGGKQERRKGITSQKAQASSAQGLLLAQARMFGGCIGIAISSIIMSQKVSGYQLADTDEDGVVSSGELPANLATSSDNSLSPAQWTLLRDVYPSALRQDMICLLRGCGS